MFFSAFILSWNLFVCTKVFSLFEKMFSFLFFAFLKDFSRFLFKQLFCVSLFSSFFLPFSSCFSLLVFCLPLGFFTVWAHFVLFRLSFLMVAMVFGFFDCQLQHLQFFCLFHFFWTKKKTFVLKSTFWYLYEKIFRKCFEIWFVSHISFCV